MACIKENPENQNDKNLDRLQSNLLVEEDSSVNGSFSKQVSFELGVDTDFMSFQTKMRILETIFESTKIPYDKKLRLKRALTFNDPDFQEETFIKDTLEACLPDLDKKSKYWDIDRFQEFRLCKQPTKIKRRRKSMLK